LGALLDIVGKFLHRPSSVLSVNTPYIDNAISALYDFQNRHSISPAHALALKVR
jgi:hypothetical protein